MLTPQLEARAFRIWQVANPIDWRLPMTEVAESIDVPYDQVRYVCHLKGWSHRFIKSKREARFFGQRQPVDKLLSNPNYAQFMEEPIDEILE